MIAARGRICAVGLLLIAGCASDYFKLAFFQMGGGGQEQVIAGSLESVSQSTQAALSRLGLSAVVTEQGEDVRIAATTPRGQRFTVVLTREKSIDATERTRVRIEWEEGIDKELGLHILSQLVVASPR
ncbi:MAG TPA: hypothetical protein VNK04_24370 [Gemmataceae bacterium]|nr:hypothetical protein [Gemmataceae bacterium]